MLSAARAYEGSFRAIEVVYHGGGGAGLMAKEIEWNGNTNQNTMESLRFFIDTTRKR